MITLPNEQTLIRHVRESLNAVADRDRVAGIPNGEWFPAIASGIAKRIKQPGLKSYARGKPDSCDGVEWNRLDFLALLYDEDEQFPAQAVVVGEIEIASDSDDEIDSDFEKLLIVDSLVFFMVFQEYSEEHALAKLNQLEAAAKRRQDHARMRGMTRPPAFLISCCIVDEGKRFIHRSG